MPALCRSLCTLSLTFLLFVLPAMGRADSPYWILLRDGQRLEGQELHHWHGGEKTKLDDNALFDSENPPRVIRRTGATVRLTGPYVEFTNGDILPGQVTNYLPASGSEASAAFTVALPPGAALLPSDSGALRVRADAVRVMVFDSRRRIQHYRPGTVLLRDGRQLETRELRVSSNGVLLLTASGLVQAAFNELSELHLPERDWNVAETQRRWMQWSQENMLLESLVLECGARFTIPQGMSEMQTHYRSEQFAYCAVQPLWALDMLFFNPEQAAVSVYRRLNEVPLSLLPATTLRQHATIHSWPWQRDRNVHGNFLASGNLSASEGFGVHGSTSLAIELPPDAVSLAGWVGIDRSSGPFGAMQCELLKDAETGASLWKSPLLRGGEEPEQFGPLDVSECRQIVLRAESNPAGADSATHDPFDIGDNLSWLLTTVTLGPPSEELLASSPIALGDWIPELAGWRVADASAQVQLWPTWNPKEERWRYSLGLRKPEEKNRVIWLTRREKITLANAYLEIGAASHVLHAGYELSIWAGDEKVGSTMNADPKTSHQVGHFSSRVYILGDYAEREIDLRLKIEPSDPRPPGSGVFFEAAELRPLITNLPPGGKPLVPEVCITELPPLSGQLDGEPWEPRTDGSIGTRNSLNIRGYLLDRGFGGPSGSEVTYALQPEWTRFVALIGLAHGWKGAGPFEVLVDGEQMFISSDPDKFKRNDPGQQISIPIEPGSKQITLKVGGESCVGAWAEAGFLTE